MNYSNLNFLWSHIIKWVDDKMSASEVNLEGSGRKKPLFWASFGAWNFLIYLQQINLGKSNFIYKISLRPEYELLLNMVQNEFKIKDDPNLKFSAESQFLYLSHTQWYQIKNAWVLWNIPILGICSLILDEEVVQIFFTFIILKMQSIPHVFSCL